MSSSSGGAGRPRKITSANSSRRKNQKGRSSVSVSMTTASSGKAAANSLCGSRISTRSFGSEAIALLSSSVTAVDLPTPVVPTMAKCLASIEGTWIVASRLSS
ncbi:hypothetical protein D9M72_449440 [compost metagenome]